LEFHRLHGKWATVTAIQPPGRYGALQLEDSSVVGFQEKPDGDGAWINGGFFVLEPEVFEYIEGDHTGWESTPLDLLAQQNQLMAYQHTGFWQAMDTLRDKNQLEELWQNVPPWKIW
jgi:glucose-1-phosphate cytidylyltransferase